MQKIHVQYFSINFTIHISLPYVVCLNIGWTLRLAYKNYWRVSCCDDFASQHKASDPNTLVILVLFLFSLCLSDREEFCGFHLTRRLSLTIQVHQNLLCLLSMGAVQTNLGKYSIAIWFLNGFAKEDNEKNTSKNPERALRHRNADKIIVLLRRSKYDTVPGPQSEGGAIGHFHPPKF